MEKRENFSMKRKAILTALRETKSHPTAEWIYHQLRPKYPNLSLGTVYRNLRFLCERGRAVSLGVINGQEHFDGNFLPHAHFICEKCGSVLDVPHEFFNPESLRTLSQVTGQQVQSASVTFRGICQNCQSHASGEAEGN